MKLLKRCNNIVSYEFLWIHRTCAYILLNAHHRLLFSIRISVMVRIMIRFSVWLVIGYAHVFVVLFIVPVTLPSEQVSDVHVLFFWSVYQG